MKLLRFVRPSRLQRGMLSRRFVGANLVFARVFRAIGQGRTQGSPLLRRGSVLIMCVVLIVILALIGTAMLSTARIDRYTAAQHSANVQIDLLMEGAKNIVRSVIIADLYDMQAGAPPRLRVPTEQSQGASSLLTYEHWDAPTMQTSGTIPLQNDQWLGSLLPRMLVDGNLRPITPIFWDAISGPLVGTNFEDPTSSVPITGNPPQVYMAPTVRRVTYADGSLETYPALVALNNPNRVIVGSDADGDGIADSLLSRMLPGALNGVSYYLGVRIVDNAAKVNVNTAWSQENDFAEFGGRIAMFNPVPLNAGSFAGNLGMFSTHVGLLELFAQSDPMLTPRDDPVAAAQIRAVNRYKMGYPTTLLLPTFRAFLDPAEDNAGTFSPRTDYRFITQGDALHHNLSIRIGNPSWNRTTPTTAQKYRAFGITDATRLARRFTLLDLESSRSELEDTFFQAYALEPQMNSDDPDSLVRTAANYVRPTGPQSSRVAGQKCYQPDQVLLWYDQNFNFDRAFGPVPVAPGTLSGQLTLDSTSVPYPRPIRAMITSFNPVSNMIAAHDMSLPAPRGVGDVQKTDDQLGQPFLMPNYSGGASPARSPVKTNINTARFGELWSAFWNVMVDQSPDPIGGNPRNGTSFTVPPGLVPTYADLTYYGNEFDQNTFQPIPSALFPGHPAQMFRSPLREMRLEIGDGVGVYMEPDQVMLLRSALAAVNAEDLRDADHDPTRREIRLQVIIDGARIDTFADLYGMERQPYITEVYANNDSVTDFAGGRNPKGYVAVELYNPYPQDIDIGGWVLAVVDRRTSNEPPPAPPPGGQGSNPYPGSSGTGQAGLSYFYIHDGVQGTTDGGAIIPPTPLPAGLRVPAHGFLVLHNLAPPGTPDPGENAVYFPSTQGLAGPGNAHFVPNLHWVMRDENPVAVTFKEGRGGELVLLRPVDPGAPALLENRNGAPVDCFDFTGMTSGAREVEIANGDPASASLSSRHYYRSTGASPMQPNWRFVFPGRYNALEYDKRRQQGTTEEGWNQGQEDPMIASIAASLGAPNVTSSYPTVHTIQIFDSAGPNPVGAAGGNAYPFGGFMRDGDILQVPFIGSYAIRLPQGAGEPLSTLEVNPITADSSFGNDTDLGNDENPNDSGTPEVESREQVGRFCPLRIIDTTNGASEYNDLDPDGDFDRISTDTNNKWRYRWAIDLFDYLTVNTPGNDYAPNVPTNQTTAYTPARLPVDNDGDGVVGDIDVSVATPQQGPNLEDTVPVHGLININTAPWRVLAAIPWVQYDQDIYTFDEDNGRFTGSFNQPQPNGIRDNIDIAKAMVAWRDGRPGTGGWSASGPFRSIFDLYRVVDRTTPVPVRVLAKVQDDKTAASEPDDADGDFSPLNAGSAATDGVREDFEEQFLLLTRVSNLLTTRSDSFTVYLQVQGWVGAPGPNARMVVQRRAAFIIDRSAVTVDPTSVSNVNVITVPTD